MILKKQNTHYITIKCQKGFMKFFLTLIFYKHKIEKNEN
jgi:hypothetical protein